MASLSLLIALLAASVASGLRADVPETLAVQVGLDDEPITPRPLVIYHGMGDAGCSDPMLRIKEFLEEEVPGLYVHNVHIGKSCQDEAFTFLDNVNRQVDEVCKTLKNDQKLAGGFNAMGFSQGGQFLRAYVQRCNDPPVHNLITFGSQHQGVETAPGCIGYKSIACEAATKLLATGAYLSSVQNRVVQAQYFKDPFNIPKYLKSNIFLPDINNELAVKNPIYKQRLESLNLFVMYKFKEDSTVVPRESSWFGFFDGKTLKTLREMDIYTEDWIGLRSLDEKGRLLFREAPGQHMHIPLELLREEIIPLLLD